jgi:hypothetical protein
VNDVGAEGQDDFASRLHVAYENIPRQFDVEVDAVTERVASRRRRRRVAVACVGVAAVGVGGWVGWSQAVGTGSSGTTAAVVVTPSQIERYSSATAADWVRYADVVAVVTVQGEQRGDTSSLGDSSGESVIARSVTLRVVRELWQQSGSPELGRGDDVTVSAAGWVQSSDGTLTRMAMQQIPRLEEGHTYVVALKATCPSTATTVWQTLGSNAIIPDDGNRLGYGESEGREVSGDEDQSLPGTLERQVLGSQPDAIRKELLAASADRGVASSKDTPC